MSSEQWTFPKWEPAVKDFADTGQKHAGALRAVEESKAEGDELFARAYLKARREDNGVEDSRQLAALDPDYSRWKRVDHPPLNEAEKKHRKRLEALQSWFDMARSYAAFVRAEMNYQ